MSPKIVDGSFAALFDNNEVHFCSTIEGELELKLNGKVVFGFWTRRFLSERAMGPWRRAELRSHIHQGSAITMFF